MHDTLYHPHETGQGVYAREGRTRTIILILKMPERDGS
jgi:hypothetical protein